jgi:hypothetical protein
MIRNFRATMPAMFDHAGIWTGTYTHIAPDLTIIDQHESRVECVFPDDGPYAYIQHNLFTWADGRTARASLPGIFRDGRLWWDVETFYGSAWQSLDGEILLHLHRKDEPGASFREIILLGEGGTYRTRTWHWFKNGRLIRRTLCEEVRGEDVRSKVRRDG